MKVTSIGWRCLNNTKVNETRGKAAATDNWRKKNIFFEIKFVTTHCLATTKLCYRWQYYTFFLAGPIVYSTVFLAWPIVYPAGGAPSSVRFLSSSPLPCPLHDTYRLHRLLSNWAKDKLLSVNILNQFSWVWSLVSQNMSPPPPKKTIGVHPDVGLFIVNNSLSGLHPVSWLF